MEKNHKTKSGIYCLLIVISLCLLITGCAFDTPIKKVVLIQNDFDTVYLLNDTIDISKLTLIVYYEDGTERPLAVRQAMVSGVDLSVLGKQKLTVSYMGFEASIDIVVLDDPYLDITYSWNYDGFPDQKERILYGTKAVDIAPTERIDYDFIGWTYNGELFDFNSPIYSDITLIAKWEIKMFEVSYEVNGEIVKLIQIPYGSCLEDNFKPDIPGYDFIKWQCNGNDYDFTVPITENVILKAVVEFNKTAMANWIKQQFASIMQSMKPIDYFTSDWNSMLSLIENANRKIARCITAEAMLEIFHEAEKDIKNTPTIKQSIINLYKNLSEIEYFDEQWKEITYIYNNVLNYLNNYQGGAPIPEKAGYDAMESMKNILTKEEDIEVGNHAKIIRIRELDTLYQSIDKHNYTYENRELIDKFYNEGIIAINNAIGTKAVANAYATAYNGIVNTEKLAPNVCNAIKLLNNSYFSYKKENYFDKQWSEITLIYETAYNNLLNYDGGAPLPMKIADDAITSMETVLTKEEDIKAGEILKAVRIRDLIYYVEALDQRNYSVANWNKILEELEKGKQNISKAEGTAAVASAYNNAINTINAIEKK